MRFIAPEEIWLSWWEEGQMGVGVGSVPCEFAQQLYSLSSGTLMELQRWKMGQRAQKRI